jgi:short subunit dehydrogenase-like uncharacterized protein
MPTPTLIVYGATAFTAQPLLQYLKSHPDKGHFSVILSGRNLAKLDALNEKHGTHWPVIPADLKNEAQVVSLVENGDIVLNLAGPFARNGGESLVKWVAHSLLRFIRLVLAGISRS